MTQWQRVLSALAVILRHMEQAARRGDVDTLKGHIFVCRAIIDRAKENT